MSLTRHRGLRYFSGSENVSTLTSSLRSLRPHVLHAAVADILPPTPSSSSCNGRGDWSEVRGQAAVVSSWPSHPLQLKERLNLAEAIASRPAELGLGESAQGLAVCSLFKALMSEDNSVFGVRSDGTARIAVVMVDDVSRLPAAISEITSFLLRGFAVSLAAPAGPTLDTARMLAEDFPASLFQVVESGQLSELPMAVRAIRVVGSLTPVSAWYDQQPPSDFGGRLWQGTDAGPGLSHGMQACIDVAALARTNVDSLPRLSRSRYELSEEASDLAALLSTAPAAEVPSVPGLPPPRWSRSPFDRGLEEIHDFLDFLWAFRKPLATVDASKSVQLAPSRKHFLLTTSGTEVPEDMVKSAIASAMSPFKEPVTLHAIGLGPRGLSKDPLCGFCRLVESGQSGLEWKLKEHESWAAFFTWLRSEEIDASVSATGEFQMQALGPPMFFGTLRGSEEQLRRLSAAAGGVSWPRLFASEPWEQLRRWTQPVLPGQLSSPILRADLTSMSPEVEVLRPVPSTE